MTSPTPGFSLLHDEISLIIAIAQSTCKYKTCSMYTLTGFGFLVPVMLLKPGRLTGGEKFECIIFYLYFCHVLERK